METIAVLFPVYRGDKPEYFLKSLNSVLGQTYTDIKVLIGVDGPVEGELAKLIENLNDVRIRVIYFNVNRGLACVLNDLISESRALGYKWLARMDADDICVPARFQMQYDYMQQHPEVDVLGGAIEEIDKHDNKNGKCVQYPLTHMACRDFFRYRDPLAHPATFFRLRFFDKVNGYRPEYRKNQDTMLWFDGFLSGCVFANLPNTVLYFRVTEDFYARRDGWKRANQMMRSRLEINKAMRYDMTANLFASAMFVVTLSPTWFKKFLYRMR